MVAATMLAQVSRIGKRLLAVRALVRFLPGVEPSVCVQHALHLETLPTKVTGERAFLAVQACVPTQLVPSVECTPAHLTGVRLDRVMATFMQLERLAGEERLVAETAGEGAHATVHSHVLLEKAAEVEAFAALVACIGHALGVRGAVVDETCQKQLLQLQWQPAHVERPIIRRYHPSSFFLFPSTLWEIQVASPG